MCVLEPRALWIEALSVFVFRAAQATFLPQAQALLRHRQEAVAEKRPQALLHSWAKLQDLARSLGNT